MQTNTLSTIDTSIAKTENGRIQPIIPSPFRWLRDLNAAFIGYFRFKDLTAEQLRDMGITKRQQDDAFLRQFTPRSAD
ncbi:hypothetical protein [Oricola indica]|jgi:hypothetical protein|uniref:hypothetical protein n=1 Tax=Oricola indica TaxID=2872591 RepID=UPI001CBCBA01|nr:hypothetical protein [Oricola indica]